jgi:hypothetical protein
VFRAVGTGTEVRVFHEGWEGAEDPAATRRAYVEAWPMILEKFARFMGSDGSSGEETPDATA